METTTSQNILKYLQEEGFVLTTIQKNVIREKILKALEESYNSESNGCDCGQMCCLVCHG